jgi:hypothetical protein
LSSIIIEDKKLKREQHFLDLLNTLPKILIYNIAIFAEAPFTGLIHTPDSRALMSEVKLGDNNPMSGKVPANALTVNVYSAVDNQLVRSFSSQVACAKWLDVSEFTVRQYIKAGKVFRTQYLIVRSISPL